MPPNIDQIYEEALKLPDESKAALAERIVEYLETCMPPDLERVHLDTVKRRRDEMKQRLVEPVDGREASVLAHSFDEAQARWLWQDRPGRK